MDPSRMAPRTGDVRDLPGGWTSGSVVAECLRERAPVRPVVPALPWLRRGAPFGHRRGGRMGRYVRQSGASSADADFLLCLRHYGVLAEDRKRRASQTLAGATGLGVGV